MRRTHHFGYRLAGVGDGAATATSIVTKMTVAFLLSTGAPIIIVAIWSQNESHHANDDRPSVMKAIPSNLGPQPDDIGNANPCSNVAPPPGGVRCIFGTVGTK